MLSLYGLISQWTADSFSRPLAVHLPHAAMQ